MNKLKPVLTTVAVSVVVLIALVYPFVDTNKRPETLPTVVAPVKKVEKKVIAYTNKYLPNFAEIRDVNEKKSTFFGYLHPLVNQVNDDIASQRAFIISLEAMPEVGESKSQFLSLVNRYLVKKERALFNKGELDFNQTKSILLKRVDTLPAALVLMQAANESAWGTSRFALQANNLFGQWCFTPGCGVVPTGRPEGEHYEVRKFSHPIDSIKSYFNNINTGHAYVTLRELRAQQRELDQELDATLLAEGLEQYSIRREEYVIEIQNMIRVNKKYL